MLNDKQSVYRGIFKGTAIFGGTQVLQIIANMIRGKFSAILIGAVGMGILSLYTSSLSVVIVIAALGINSSAVRDISLAYNESQEILERKISLIKKMIYFSGGVGIFITVIFSPFLSYFTYGNFDHTWIYFGLSLYVLFTILQQGYIAILQGCRYLKKTALSSLFGSIFTLICSIPIFYFLGIKGIAICLVLCSFFSFLVTQYFISTLKFKKVLIPLKNIIHEGKPIICLGIMLVLAVFIGNVSTYFINIAIQRIGDIKDVGLYQAAISITTQALSLIFSSMAADYYPKLVQIVSDKTKRNELVNSQIEIILLLALPILMSIIIFSPLIISLLLSPEFNEISNFIRWVSIGMFFQAMCFPIGYIAFAKGDKTVYFLLEGVWSNVLQVFLKILGYYLGGLEGLAISFAVNGLLNIIVSLFITLRIYEYKINLNTLKIAISVLGLLILAFILTIIPNETLMYIIHSLLLILTMFYSLRELNTRIDLKDILYRHYEK